MDVLESLLSRLPQEWWYAIYPKDCDDCDYILPYLPISHEYMMRIFEMGGLLHRRSLSKDKFNNHFKGKFEITTYKRRNGKQIYYVRNYGDNKIRHNTKDQVYGVVDLITTGVHVLLSEINELQS